MREPLADDGGLRGELRRERLAQVRIGDAATRALASLDADSFEQREAASRALLELAITDAELWSLLDRDTLSGEARERLLDAACRRILERPRGALGIRMGTSMPPRQGVLVQSTVPGLPADRVLVSGDVVQRVDDLDVATSADLADALQTRAPGQEIRLQVLRAERDAAGKPLQGPDGQPVERKIELRLPLGNAADLERMDRVDPRLGPNQVSGVVMQRRRTQVAILQRRFGNRGVAEAVAESGQAVEPSPGSAVAPE
jgi:hypothetical protein